MGEDQGRPVVPDPPPGAAIEDAATAPVTRQPTRRAAAWVLVLPATAALLALFVIPMGAFVAYSFLEGGFFEVSRPFTLSNFEEALTDPLARHLAGNALLTGAVTGAISVGIGLPLAFVLRFMSGRLEYPLLFLVVLSMFASFLARIYAWRTLLEDSGVINQALGAIGLPPQSILFTRVAVVLALVHVFVPYVTLVAYAALRNIPRDLLDLAADLGAGPLTRWRRVLMPLLAPAATAAFLYTFVLAASDYVTPQFLGGKTGNMIGVLIQTEFTRLGDFPLGAATSLLMLGFFLAFYAALATLLRTLGLTRVASRY